MLMLPTITPLDRESYPYHSDLSIKGIKLIEQQSKTFVLRAMRGRNNQPFKSILDAMGQKTNPNWITAQCAEHAYRKGWIDEDEFIRRVR